MDKTLDKLPLRYPGQSLQEHLANHLESSVMALGYTGGACIGIMVFSAVVTWRPEAANPWLVVPTALLVLVIVAYVTIRRLKALKSYRLGLRGEQLVGEVLNQRVSDAESWIYHDLVFDDFNVDHLIVSTKGIMAAETKAVHNDTTKEAQKRITVHDDHVDIGGFKNTEHLAQALRSTAAIKKLLAELGFHDVQVEAALIYPGRWVESNHPKVLVRNETAFCTSFGKRPVKIDLQTVKQMRAALDRHLRLKS